jgi:hypothetical protein
VPQRGFEISEEGLERLGNGRGAFGFGLLQV